MPFTVSAPFQPMGDQPGAIDSLAKGIENGDWAQVLLGATGTGKTFTMAKLIERVQKPTLVIAHIAFNVPYVILKPWLHSCVANLRASFQTMR